MGESTEFSTNSCVEGWGGEPPKVFAGALTGPQGEGTRAREEGLPRGSKRSDLGRILLDVEMSRLERKSRKCVPDGEGPTLCRDASA